MAFNQFPQKGGIPSGNTAGRPSNPIIGDTYYNGQVEALEIYNGTNWKVVKSEGFPPDAPTITSVTDSSTSLAYSSTAGTLDVVFVPAGTGGTATQYNAYTTTGGHSGFTTVGNTVTIVGLTPGTAYTVYGNAQNGSGVSTNTANASPVTPTTLPEVRTIGTATASTSANEVTVTWTNTNNGGKNLSAITITPFLNGTTAETSRTAATTSSTSYTFTDGQLTGNAAYTFKVKATNANGTCADSTATNSATMPQFISVDYLVVAGGGAGNYSNGNGGTGGGGAGGLRSTVTNTGGLGSLETPSSAGLGTNYTVTVGGGAASVQGSTTLYPGSNSVFSSITSTGGGGGSYGQSGNPGGPGGSGGGAGENNSTGGTRTASPVQGFDGGGALTGSDGSGGGGAGAVGVNATNAVRAGNGGNGVAVSITGTSVTYAGGGGGSSYSYIGGDGGTGGGGNGTGLSNRSSATAGDTNKGGGGGSMGGSRGYGGSSAGCSGVFILR